MHISNHTGNGKKHCWEHCCLGVFCKKNTDMGKNSCSICSYTGSDEKQNTSSINNGRVYKQGRVFINRPRSKIEDCTWTLGENLRSMCASQDPLWTLYWRYLPRVSVLSSILDPMYRNAFLLMCMVHIYIRRNTFLYIERPPLYIQKLYIERHLSIYRYIERPLSLHI